MSSRLFGKVWARIQRKGSPDDDSHMLEGDLKGELILVDRQGAGTTERFEGSG